MEREGGTKRGSETDRHLNGWTDKQLNERERQLNG